MTTTFQAYLPDAYDMQLYELGLIDTKPTDLGIIFNRQMTYAADVLFWVVIFLVKASFLALYWKVFRISRRFRIAWWATSVYTFASFAAIFLSIILHCGYKPQYLADPGKSMAPLHTIL